MGYVGDTVKDRGKYVVGMGNCVEVCVELYSCMFRVWGCWIEKQLFCLTLDLGIKGFLR
jgi:hypothetical protein